MTDSQITTIQVIDHLTTRQDRLDGPVLLEQVRAALLDDGIARLSFAGVDYVTPTLVNEALVPLLDSMSIDVLRSRLHLADASRHIADIVRNCMELGVRHLAGEFDAGRTVLVVTGSCGDAEAEMAAHLARASYGMHFTVIGDEDIGRMIDEERARLNDPDISMLDRMMQPTLRDMGITVISCGDSHMDRAERLAQFDCIVAGPLPENGYDHRHENARWNQQRGRRPRTLPGRRR